MTRLIALLIVFSGMLFTQDLGHPGLMDQSDRANPYCLNCHTCAEPTAANPCLLGCPRHTGKLYGEHEVTEGPEMVILDQLSVLYSPVVFTHKLHASMSNLDGGCGTCHHFSNPDEPIPACRTCHPEYSDLADIKKPSLKGAYHRQCINCHREWSHESSCNECHVPIDGEGPVRKSIDRTDIVGIPHPHITAQEKYVYSTTYKKAPVVTFHHTDHVDLFGLSCASCHQGDNCQRCHDESAADKPGISHLTSCNSCHDEKNCDFCHARQEKPAFAHAVSTGWDLGERHKDVKCTSCHGPVKNFTSPSTVCTDCHIHWELGSFDHAVTGLTLSETHVEFECENCHINGNFANRPGCDNCHDDIEFPEYMPGELAE